MKRRTRVVPGLVLSASFVAVVPACALVACGGLETGRDGGSDAQNDILFGVAAVGFCTFCDAMGVADIGFIPDADAHEADAPSDAPEGG